MCHQILSACLTTSFIVLGSTLTSHAQAPEASIEILATFDYPAVTDYTNPEGINDNGDVAGSYIDLDAGGASRGFVRFRNGNFSPPIIAFGDGDYTEADDINTGRTVCGSFYKTGDETSHGYFLSEKTFTQFDIDGAFGTSVLGLNDAGDFVGLYQSEPGVAQAFIDAGGNITRFNVPEALLCIAYAINASRETVGIYENGSDGNIHGFLRNELGNLTFPLDFPGALGTYVRGINDRGWMVGTYYDSNYANHGFVIKTPNAFLSFDYPNALGTTLNGINNNGLVCGSYYDITGVSHGFIARFRR